jgi:hypothetical protein
MTLPAYARTREGEAPQLSCDPPSCQVGLCVRKGPHVITLVGTGLFDFGDVNGVGDEVRLQHVLAVCFVDGMVYLLISHCLTAKP